MGIPLFVKKKVPFLLGFCVIADEAQTLAIFLVDFWRAVGRKATIHILVPSAKKTHMRLVCSRRCRCQNMIQRAR